VFSPDNYQGLLFSVTFKQIPVMPIVIRKRFHFE
jgi:hypothetical protein